ncbi:MAG TPA: DUF2071 domain-containing protein, partial [Cyclobacteriaceae bacterium]
LQGFFMPTPFLTAEWRKLAMANYVVDPSLLAPFLPPKTEIDLWNGRCYVSLVAFMFVNTRVKGFRIPFHVDFEEINLRFYVRHNEKRGVVFIKEIVSKPLVTLIANSIYKENYETLTTDHSWIATPGILNVEYRWKKKDWNVFRVSSEKTSRAIADGSEEQFITEHYWGYVKSGSQSATEYQVDHPKWEVYPVRSFSVDVDFGKVYGEHFSILDNLKPASVFLAEGSPISVLNSGKV